MTYRDVGQCVSRKVARGLLAIVVWWLVLSPALGLVSTFLLPPDPFTLQFVFVPYLVLGVLAGLLSESRSASLSQLVRFGIAVYVILIVIGFPVVTVYQFYGHYGTRLALITALLLLAVTHATGYYLTYGGGYDRLKAQYLSSSRSG